jgi:hypothetical protein
MSFAERLVKWNRWYDEVPEMWRFQFVVWSLLILGAINMALTVAFHFPFALLVVLGILAIATIRVPYTYGWIKASGVESTEQPSPSAHFQIEGASWIFNLNHWYDSLPEARRLWVYPAVLLLAGAINMMLTIRLGFAFGPLFLLALLALVIIRAPYAAGWLRPPHAPMINGGPASELLEHDVPLPTEAPHQSTETPNSTN